jgi:hypothetical protein
MNSNECLEYLNQGQLPPCLEFNINKNEIIDFTKLNYNDYTINILRQKRHKYLLKLPFYSDYLEEVVKIANSEKPIKQLEEMKLNEEHLITHLYFDN